MQNKSTERSLNVNKGKDIKTIVRAFLLVSVQPKIFRVQTRTPSSYTTITIPIRKDQTRLYHNLIRLAQIKFHYFDIVLDEKGYVKEIKIKTDFKSDSNTVKLKH